MEVEQLPPHKVLLKSMAALEEKETRVVCHTNPKQRQMTLT